MSTTDEAVAPAAEQPEEAADPRRWKALLVVMSASFMNLLDGSIVNVATPAIQRDLNTSYSAIQWIAAGYTLAFAAILITGGRLGDIRGRKTMFAVGVLGFTVASALCGASTSGGMLIASRVLQGAFAAVMVPQVLGIIRDMFPRKEQVVALSMYGPVMGLAAVCGPVLGGVLTQGDLFGLGWRPIFFVNIPVGLAAFFATGPLLRDSRSPRPLKLDLVGVVLIVTALLMLVAPVIEGREHGWPLWTFVCMAASLPVFVLTALYERYKDRKDGSPLVELSLFRNRTYLAGLVVTVIFFAGMASFFLVFALYLQIGLGFSTLRTGLTIGAWALGTAVGGAAAGGFLGPKFGRKVLQAGALLMAVSVAGTALTVNHYGPDVTSMELVPTLLLAGIGMGLVLAPLFDIILAGVSDREIGSGSGTLNAVNQIGNTIGVAVLATLFFTFIGQQAGTAAQQNDGPVRAALTAAAVPAARQDVVLADFTACSKDQATNKNQSEIPASCARLQGDIRSSADSPQAAKQIGAAIAEVGTTVREDSFTDAVKQTLWIEVGLFALTFLLGFLLPRHSRGHVSDPA
ncbi:MFS transporter [Kitasatospora sp. NPDC097643]|uniref:MFS transporter n=1 Tax=Kitasatospora sp. NPDC097643 TaxID=3157230 RepID=UPI00331B7007